MVKRERPAGLPDFSEPPLDEVVLGVQFAAPAGYTTIHAQNIWNLFKTEFPNVREEASLEPTFETFGGSNIETGPSFKIGNAPIRPRYWFMSEEQNHLIQFQEDRFLLNWRNRPRPQDYPRFESIAESFEDNLKTLHSYFEESLSSSIEVNQAEVSYINLIDVSDYKDLSKWFSMINPKGFEIEGLSVNFPEVIYNDEGKPYARLFHNIQSVITRDGSKKGFRFTLTFKGKPANKDILSAMEFLHKGREAIVNRFMELTSPDAHDYWERKQ